MAIQLATRQLKKDQKCLALDYYMLRVLIVILEQRTTLKFFVVHFCLWFDFYYLLLYHYPLLPCTGTK